MHLSACFKLADIITIRENYVSMYFCGRVPWLARWVNGFVVVFYVQEHPKAQPAVVLVLKCLRRRGHSLKSHPTDWEKPGIEPARHRFIPYTTENMSKCSVILTMYFN